MKKIVLFSLMMALPFMVLAQNDDLYFIPKKKAEKKEKVTTPSKVVVEMQEQNPTTVYAEPGSKVIVVKDVNGKARDIDEYNRRYTSRDSEFSYENDTLYIQEKPSYEQGEWINGFEGTQSDYDYAMRLIRFRSPRFAVSVSSPFYWDVISLGYSWDWNVYDDGFYAYAFPTFGSHLWWNWRYDYSWRYRPYSYWSWSYPSWHFGYWGGGWCPPHYHHSHWHGFPPHYAHGGVGGYWGNNHGWHGSSAHNPGIHSGRYKDVHRREAFPARSDVNRSQRNSRNDYVNARRSGQTVTRNSANVARGSSGRVVTSRDANSSVRPQRSAAQGRSGQAVNKGTTNTRSSGVYTRQSQGRSSSYNRASSTRSTVTNSGSWGGRSGSGGSYSSGSSSSGGSSRGSSISSGSSSRSSSGSYSSGSGGGGRSAGSGGGSRSSGGRR